jgi:hypothetical protein
LKSSGTSNIKSFKAKVDSNISNFDYLTNLHHTKNFTTNKYTKNSNKSIEPYTPVQANVESQELITPPVKAKVIKVDLSNNSKDVKVYMDNSLNRNLSSKYLIIERVCDIECKNNKVNINKISLEDYFPMKTKRILYKKIFKRQKSLSDLSCDSDLSKDEEVEDKKIKKNNFQILDNEWIITRTNMTETKVVLQI